LFKIAHRGLFPRADINTTLADIAIKKLSAMKIIPPRILSKKSVSAASPRLGNAGHPAGVFSTEHLHPQPCADTQSNALANNRTTQFVVGSVPE
jgi:hypothetical protein